MHVFLNRFHKVSNINCRKASEFRTITIKDSGRRRICMLPRFFLSLHTSVQQVAVVQRGMNTTKEEEEKDEEEERLLPLIIMAA